MDFQDNISLLNEIQQTLLSGLPVRLGVNKTSELTRLVYEIARRDGLSCKEVFATAGLSEIAGKGKSGLFRKLKENLMSARYPSHSSGSDAHIMPVRISTADSEYSGWNGAIEPKRIFVEKGVAGEPWTRAFLEKFPRAEVSGIDKFTGSSAAWAGKSYDSRRDNIYLVRNRAAFIKRCPCTKGAERCGYWILNLGFGCPMDCSYCYLGLYSNAPGLILPANIDDYRGYVEDFDRKAAIKMRIGTGEFTDSLALDSYTGYASTLIAMFENIRNLELELKTKAADIDHVLEEEPHENVVLSWSVNTESMAGKYERGAPCVEDRIRAAEKAAARGFRVGFHFDPVIYYPGWEREYSETVERLLAAEKVRRNCAWISLGTLRYTPGLKQSAERRFSDNRLFYYGEFFKDFDGKMRYPENLRTEIYRKMIESIRGTGTETWIYLCMESDRVWRQTPLGKRNYSQRREGA